MALPPDLSHLSPDKRRVWMDGYYNLMNAQTAALDDRANKGVIPTGYKKSFKGEDPITGLSTGSVPSDPTSDMQTAAKAAGVTPTQPPSILDTARSQMQQNNLKGSVKDMLNDPVSPESGRVIPDTAVNLFKPGAGAPPLITPKDKYVFPFNGQQEERTMHNRVGEIANGRPDPLTPGVVDKAAEYVGNKAVGAATDASNAIAGAGKIATQPIYDYGTKTAPKIAAAIQPTADAAYKGAKSYTGELAESWKLPKIEQPTVPTSSPSENPTANPQSSSETRSVYNPSDAKQQALAQLNPFIQKRLENIYDHASRLSDPTARANYLSYATAGLKQVQDTFSQRAQSDAARRAGLVVQGSDGQDRTMAMDAQGNMTPQAGDVIDGNGRVTRADVGPGTVSKDSQGRNVTTFHTPYGDVSSYRDKSLDTQRSSGMGKINDLPSDQANQKLANDLLRQGILNPSPDYNRSKVGTNGNPSEAANKDGTVTNQKTGDTFTRQFVDPYAGRKVDQASYNANQPVPQQGASENSPTISVNKPSTGGLTVQDALNPSPQDLSDIQPKRSFEIPSAEQQEQAVQKTVADNEQKNAPIRDSEAKRWGNYSARQALEKAYSDQPNGDPLRDSQLAVNRAEAAKQMAIANGATPQQLKDDPSIAAKYLRGGNDFNATSSDDKLNQIAMAHLRGDGMRDLVQQAVDSNISGSKTSEDQNKRALDQNAKQATIEERGEKAEDRKAALRIAEQNAADRKEEKAATASANRIKGLEGRLDRIDKEIEKNTTDLGDIGKKGGAAKNLESLNKKRASVQTQLDKENGLEPEVDSENPASNNTPQPNNAPVAVKTIKGKRYAMINGELYEL